MKLYITTTTLQARNALTDFLKQTVYLITSNLCFKGTLKIDRKTGIFYVKKKSESIEIDAKEVSMIVSDDNQTRIILRSEERRVGKECRL